MQRSKTKMALVMKRREIMFWKRRNGQIPDVTDVSTIRMEPEGAEIIGLSSSWSANSDFEKLLYCTMFWVCNPTMMPSVQFWRYLVTSRVRCHFWTPICNVLGYWWHHSICYTSLFTTPLVVTTISGYSMLRPSDVVSRSGPLISSVICSVISLQCLYLGISSISVSISASLLSLSPSRCLFYLCLYLGISSISVSISVSLLCLSLYLRLSPLKSSVCVWNRRHLSRLHFPLLRFRNNLVA
jgi:multidrug transporter EmrE-like cation transporter